MDHPNYTWKALKNEIRKKNYGILSTISKDGRPHSTGILYAVSDEPFHLLLLTDKSSKKARNISRNPNVSFAIPIPRGFLRFIPPSSVQFQGKAEIIPLSEDVKKAFSMSLVLRQTFSSAKATLDQPDGTCFIKITPDPIIFTYALGVPVMRLIKDPGSASGKVRIEET